MAIRWFSIRRILVWLSLVCGVLVSLVWIGRGLVGDERRAVLLASRKARLRDRKSLNGHARESSVRKEHPPAHGDGAAQHAELEAKPLALPRETRPPVELTEAWRRPFQMRNGDIKEAYEQYQAHSPTTDMATYLWRTYRVMVVPDTLREKDGRLLKPAARFEMSIKRHVALFYGEYLLKGGTEPRHFGLPVCRAIGLGPDGEYETSSLSRLAGSQGTLAFHDLEYARDGELPPFSLTPEGKLQLVTKYFKVNRKKKKSGDNDNDNDNNKEDERSPSAIERDEASAQRIFGREHYALSTIRHRGVIQPVCYEKQPRLRMIYPYWAGGDLVTLGSDHLAFYDPQRPQIILNPDDTFLPRFFRQLAEAVYAIHQAGILHLDLKPENFVVAGPDRSFVLPSDSPALRQYKLILLDFGLAMRRRDAREEKCIKVGTDVTMAPEQVMCNHAAGPGTDWWAVAASMWRTRIFWEPSITEDQRDRLLNSRCEQWGHYAFPTQPFFSRDFADLLKSMLTPHPRDRDFSKSPEALNRLLDSPYLLRGLDPEARAQRLKELAQQPRRRVSVTGPEAGAGAGAKAEAEAEGVSEPLSSVHDPSYAAS